LVPRVGMWRTSARVTSEKSLGLISAWNCTDPRPLTDQFGVGTNQ
jgi:hypothetical protein